MNVSITIKYSSPAGETTQSGTFQIAYEWWKEINMTGFMNELVSVVINEDQDLTNEVKQFEKQQRISAFNAAEDLPF
ncbi:hypothetical protein [Mesobacillus zeae]|uniref:Uncharacterized protein n=1 Tax=Mesobacillus zeae TaxID=1917180 RepID=A0A398BB23_9BACI|nr:hypothetical protein [Mesobacillus zeae]RID85060.1 hypothetical protein D1970_10870 [Mesobacillus zeae]